MEDNLHMQSNNSRYVIPFKPAMKTFEYMTGASSDESSRIVDYLLGMLPIGNANLMFKNFIINYFVDDHNLNNDYALNIMQLCSVINDELSRYDLDMSKVEFVGWSESSIIVSKVIARIESAVTDVNECGDIIVSRYV